MMNYKHHALAIFLGLTFSTCAHDSWREVFADQEWEFLQYAITEQIKERTNNNLLIKTVGAINIAAALLGSFLHIMEINRFYSHEARLLKLCSAPLYLGKALIARKICTTVLEMLLANRITQQVYNEFVAQWPENKPYTPKNLHPLFDELYALYTQNGPSSWHYHNTCKQVRLMVDQLLRMHSSTTTMQPLYVIPL